MESFLSVTDLSKVYSGGKKALNKVNFDVSQGEFIAIVGPSGAGKSTLLRLINQLIHPTTGVITFKGKEITRAKRADVRAVRREMGMIFQGFNLINRVSVLRNILHGRLGYMGSVQGMFGMFSKEDRENAWQLLERVDLTEHAYKRADALSGGQKQRVAIARALAQKPSVILADEPIASLDPASSNAVMNYLQEVCQQDGITCIVNLHQVEVAKKYATRIIGIQNGMRVFDSTPHELIDEDFQRLYNNDKRKTAG
ncbi:phosphonate ABC transporter ATP-binding protein [Virgibacillus dokdonensis]|uniref:Phosphonate ABC transporter ATP-binding protein n=1 Tax=Virgibacillus dokdonensis TaxID=302167 RepID=A0A3E0WQN6_9BACI|nr:phosphonate ABC transporter ATP-binding protein [Virgibacillus dokdonensis]RFA34317.1 phosphonate ABC transporter ATP-binding protein [Virgibacillus dokdonensis]